jgi:serine/threonine protein kinase
MNALRLTRNVDFTPKNVAIRLDKSLDNLTEDQLDDFFGEPRIEPLDSWFTGGPSPAPEYAFEVADLRLLPSDYFSTRLCVLDFDQAFLTEHPPKRLAHIPAPLLAPESIFTLTNGPAADVWALGSVLFNLREPFQPFWSFISCDPHATALRMVQLLGDLPREWQAFPFLDGYPVHEPLQPNTEYEPFDPERFTWDGVLNLEQLVGEIVEPRRPTNSPSPKTGIERFCLPIPSFGIMDRKGRNRFMASNTTPIRKEDAALFTDLLRQIFTYDHRKRITAKQILEHPWLRQPGQRSRHAPPGTGVHKLPLRTNHSKTSTRMSPAPPPGHSPATTRTTPEKTKRSQSAKKTEGTKTAGISTRKGSKVGEPNQGEKKVLEMIAYETRKLGCRCDTVPGGTYEERILPKGSFAWRNV